MGEKAGVPCPRHHASTWKVEFTPGGMPRAQGVGICWHGILGRTRGPTTARHCGPPLTRHRVGPLLPRRAPSLGASNVPLAPRPPHTGGHPVGTGPHMAGLRHSAGLRPGSEWLSLLAGGHKLGISGCGPMVPSLHCDDAEDCPPSHAAHRHPYPATLQTREGAGSLHKMSYNVQTIRKN